MPKPIITRVSRAMVGQVAVLLYLIPVYFMVMSVLVNLDIVFSGTVPLFSDIYKLLKNKKNMCYGK